jgi:hypothetical protein
MQSRGVTLLEESPDTTGQGRSVTPTRGNPRESATETTRPMARPHVSRAQAKVKWCGNSAPAPRRRGASGQTPSGARPSRTADPARRGPGRSQGPGERGSPGTQSPARQMAAHDRIRLTGLLRRSPAKAGFLYISVRQDSSRFRLTGVPNGGAALTVTAGLGNEHAATGPG